MQEKKQKRIVKEIKKIVSLFSAYLYVQYGVLLSLFHLAFGSEKT